MATSSPARAAAARANAKKSTGPKTPAGKARSCRNAVKHGLSGQGVGLLPEDQALVDHRIACWAEELGATGDLESTLVAAAASASVRRLRIERTEARRAAQRMARSQSRRLRHAESRLAEARGRLDAWESAIAGYRAGGTLSHQAKVAIGGLVGEDADRPGPVLGALIALQDRIGRWVSDADKAEARDRLGAELHRHRALALAVVEERREAVQEAEASGPADGWLDRTKAGDLLRRYHGAAERSFYRALAELDRSRRMPDSPVDDGARDEAKTDGPETVCGEPAPVGPAVPAVSGGSAGLCRGTGPRQAWPSEGTAGTAGPTGGGAEAGRIESRTDDGERACDEPVVGIQSTLPRGEREPEGPPAPAMIGLPIEARTGDGLCGYVHPDGPSAPTLAERRRAIGEALLGVLGPLAGLDPGAEGPRG